MITIEQLKEVMRFQLSNFNDENEEISDDTIHKNILSEDDGFSHVNSVSIYKDVIKFVLLKQGHVLKKWPEHWLNLTVDELAQKII